VSRAWNSRGRWDLSLPDAVVDALILGTVEGVTPAHAFLVLVRGNRALLDAAHDEVLCTQMASSEMQTFPSA